LRALNVAIACGLVACSKHGSSEEGRKPRVQLTVWLDPRAEVPSDGVSVTTSSPPSTRQMFERSGIHLAVVGVPAEGDPAPFLEKAILDAERAGSNATILVSTRCLKELQLGLEKNISPMWTVPLVVGARCDGTSKDRLVAAALVEAGAASRVRITFDVHTRAFLKVEPLR
jgi:hypothetical protein